MARWKIYGIATIVCAFFTVTEMPKESFDRFCTLLDYVPTMRRTKK